MNLAVGNRSVVLAASAVLLLGAVVASAPGQAEDSRGSNMDRLRSMPLEHRRRLAADLQRFEALPRDQQRPIRELEQQIESADPEMRDRYREVARRYYNWVQTLPGNEREALQTGSAQERLNRVHALLAKSAGADRSESLDAALARGSALNPLSFLDQVHLIRVWLELGPSSRQELEETAPAERVRHLEELGRSLGIADQRPDLRRRADEVARDWMSGRGPNGAGFGPGIMRKFESLKAQAKADYARRLAESRLLARMPTEPVEPQELNRLVNALPSWIRQSLDALPPSAARERLLLIYRNLWPSGTMPAEIRPWIGNAAPGTRDTPNKPAGPPPRGEGPPPGSTPPVAPF